MTIIDAVAMLGAIAVLMFGMSTMTDGLEKFSSGRLEKLLEQIGRASGRERVCTDV